MPTSFLDRNASLNIDLNRIEPDYNFKLNDTSMKSLNILKKITINLPINTQARSFTATFYNENGDYNNYFAYHDDIKIYLGYVYSGVVGLFHGRVEKIKKKWNKSTGSTITVSGRGMWVLMMEKFAVETYEDTDQGDVIKDLISKYVAGLTTNNVSTTGVVPPVELIDHVFINDVVTEYCKKASYDAWVDFTDDLHFTGSPGTNSVIIEAGVNVESIELSVDWKKIRNYIRAYGKKVEDVQLIKTEEDTASQSNYGTVMKIIKNASLDDTSLLQSITDAELLESKESEWGGIAVVYGDERIQPAKSIRVLVSELDEDQYYKVPHVRHVVEPKGAGFKTTVMFVEEEVNTSIFYKELYEKTKNTIDFANSGNYDESHVFKFTDDQDNLWTLVNCYTDNSTLKITDVTQVATATLINSIVGDKNYSSLLPYVSQQVTGANKFYFSNDGGTTWEQVYHDTPQNFVSSTGDKNDFKVKIELSARPALEVSCVATDKIYGIDTDDSELWNFDVPDINEEIWGLAYGTPYLYQCENFTGKIYYCNPEDGSGLTTLIDKIYTLGGCTYHSGTGRLFVIDRTNNKVVEINTSTGADEYSHDLPVAIGDPTGITFDGTNFWIADKADDLIYRMTTASTGDNVAWDSTDLLSVPEVVDPYDLAWNESNLRVVCDYDGKVHRLGYGTAVKESQETTSSNTYFGENVIVAQSFQIDYDKDCSSVEVYLKRNATANDITCILASDNAGEPSSTLKTATASGVSTSAHWEKFTWPTPQALTAATTYWIILKAEDSDNSDYTLYYNSAGGYADGQAAVDLSGQFNENFTTTEKRDVNTHADWDTSEGRCKCWYYRFTETTITADSDFTNSMGTGYKALCYHNGKIWVAVAYQPVIGDRTKCYEFNLDGSWTGNSFYYDERSNARHVQGMCSDGTNLYLLDNFAPGVSKRNASNPANEDAFYSLSIYNLNGIAFDGTYFWIGDTDDSKLYKYNSSFVYQGVYINDRFYSDFCFDSTYLMGTRSPENTGLERMDASGHYDDVPLSFTSLGNASWRSVDVNGNDLYLLNVAQGLGQQVRLITYSLDGIDAISLNFLYGNGMQNITRATLNATSNTPSGTSIAYYLSADSGNNWEQVTSGTEHTFTNQGTVLKWKAIFNNPAGSPGWAYISNIQVDCHDGATADWITQTEDIAFKVNLDGVLYDIDSFTPPGGTPRGLTYKSAQGGSGVYTLGAYLK